MIIYYEFVFITFRAETIPRVTRIQKIIEANYVFHIMFLTVSFE